MLPITIDFVPDSLGRVVFRAQVMTGDRKSFGAVVFKLDSGSDFTTLSCRDLEVLGYEKKFLESRPNHGTSASTASEDLILPLQYIDNVSIKFGDRELQDCRVFFALGTKLRSLFGSDILKSFNREISYDSGEFRLTTLKSAPLLLSGEKPIQIYSVDA